MNGTSNVFFWIFLVLFLSLGLYLMGKAIQARVLFHKQNRLRCLSEDALKIIYAYEQDRWPTDTDQLAEELSVKTHIARDVTIQLEKQDLIHLENGLLTLTEDGRLLALQIIRAHRLWERYLADEALMPLEKIHTVAHKHEHVMSVNEVDLLDADLGHPALDPHGHPIPSAAGVFRKVAKSVPLSSLETSQHFEITHLDDKPALAFAQLIAEGLYIGQKLVLIEKNHTRVVLSDDRDEYILAKVIAENVHVKSLGIPPRKFDPSVIPLSNLKTGMHAAIVNIDERIQGFTRRRLLDLGMTPGALIVPELENTFGDPRAYRIRSTLMALRDNQASKIWVKPPSIKSK